MSYARWEARNRSAQLLSLGVGLRRLARHGKRRTLARSVAALPESVEAEPHASHEDKKFFRFNVCDPRLERAEALMQGGQNADEARDLLRELRDEYAPAHGLQDPSSYRKAHREEQPYTPHVFRVAPKARGR